MRRIDAHQHFWRLDRADYGWLTSDLASIFRDFAPGDLLPTLARAGIEGTVLVQAAPTEAETAFMLSLARDNDFIKGVVGWTDLAAPGAGERIARLAAHHRLKGLRPMIQDIADDGWMLRRELDEAYAAIEAHGLVLNALVLPRHLDNLRTLLARRPALRVVIDHCAKPEIASGEFDRWATGMKNIAQTTAAFCKLSGLVTEAGPDWNVDRLRPYVDHVLEFFGPDRLIWGSDWPVCTLAASYECWLGATDALLAGCTEAERAKILGGNAVEFYRLDG